MILDEENSKSVMSIARFFCADLEGQLIELEPAEAHHLLNVRRVRAGEEVELFDGKGQKLRGRLKEAGKKTAKIEVLQRYAKSPAGVEIVVACAMAKGSRWNWLLEKCVELGAGEIWPVIFERSVATGSGSPKQLSKWNSRCIEAAKQCGQPYLPQLSQPKRLEQVLEETKDDWTGLVGTMNDARPIKSMNAGYGYVPKAMQEEARETHMPESGSVHQHVGGFDNQTVIDLIYEIVRNADVAGHGADGRTVYIMHLSPKGADTLASMFAALEDGDELDQGEGEHEWQSLLARLRVKQQQPNRETAFCNRLL